MEDQTVVALGCRKTKKLIWGMKGKKVVAFDRLPSPMSQYSYPNMLPYGS